jgi:3-hydroxy-9,10-secoandrosta-1,3,5(10)-triene-9,17-dione monooxygenase reductase component
MRHPAPVPSLVSPDALREALATFATGITVVTTRSPDGSPVGLTVNSFNSVSLAPPLVLWSLGVSSSSREAFDSHPFFTVHILGADQQPLAQRFAGPPAQRFADLEFSSSANGVPTLDGCLCVLECARERTVAAGDHVVYFGEVISSHLHAQHQGAALTYHQRRFGST